MMPILRENRALSNERLYIFDGLLPDLIDLKESARLETSPTVLGYEL